MVCTSPKKQQISRVSRVWLKNYVRHALLKFEIVLVGNPFWVKLGTSNLVESWKLMSTTTGKNLVLISQTTFEKFKINQNLLFSLYLQWYILYLWRYKMYHWRNKGNDKFWLFLNFSKVVWDINTKFWQVVVLISFQLSTKFGVPSLTKKWISHQNYFKLQEGVAGIIS